MAFVTVKGRRLAYEVSPEQGDASALTVVCIHGSGGDREDWKAQIHGLSHLFRVIALDLPGHGLSEPPGETSVSAYADWTTAFVEEIGLKRVVLTGCSLGSAVALWTALKPKSWLKALCLVGSGARLKVHPQFLEGLRNDPSKALLNLGDFALSPSTGQPLRGLIETKLRAASPQLTYGDLSACDDFNIIGELAGISLPISVIVGEDDRLTPVKYAKFLADRLPRSVLNIIPGAGHLAMVEKPMEFNAVLGDFVASLM